MQEMVTQKDNPCLLFIISGFLGSGKTTLLKHLLEGELDQGRCPHVIMSEFGDIDIDGVLVSDHRIKLTSIVGGCACCDLREKLAGTMTEIARSVPGATIFLESTGVGDPAGIIEAIKPLIESGLIIIGNIFVVYDVGRQLLSSKDNALVKRQLETADTILVNKSDLRSPGEIKATVDIIAAINPLAELIVTSRCRIDVEAILNYHSAVKPATGIKSTSDPFRSFGFQIEEPLSQKALEKWLRTLPPGVLRAKGFVKLAGQEGFYEVQATRGSVSITPFPTTNGLQSMLVLITHPMRTDGLVKGLQECMATKPE